MKRVVARAGAVSASLATLKVSYTALQHTHSQQSEEMQRILACNTAMKASLTASEVSQTALQRTNKQQAHSLERALDRIGSLEAELAQELTGKEVSRQKMALVQSRLNSLQLTTAQELGCRAGSIVRLEAAVAWQQQRRGVLQASLEAVQVANASLQKKRAEQTQQLHASHCRVTALEDRVFDLEADVQYLLRTVSAF